MNKFHLRIAAFLAITAATGYTQSLTDAVRLASESNTPGSRASAMAGAMTAAVNDYTALTFNPAGITLIKTNEFGLSLQHMSHSSDALFLGATTNDVIQATSLGSIGIVSPIKTKRGHLAFGASYDRIQDFHSAYSFSGVNPNSSFFNTASFIANTGWRQGSFDSYVNELNDENIAWYLRLTNDIDSLNPDLTTPFTSGLFQKGTVTQEGSMYALRVGAGIDVAENVAVGATVNVYSGDYNYRRVYSETDVNNIFSRTDSFPPGGFKSAQITDSRESSPAGISLKLGILATPNEYLRLGFTFETPTSYSIDDAFTRTGTSQFNFDNFSTADRTELERPIVNSYDISIPLKIGGGFAVLYQGATLSADFALTDYSQIRFDDAQIDLSDLNDIIREELTSVLTWRIGGEYVIAPIGLSLRAGYAVSPSPYKNDAPEYGVKTVTGGIGIILGENTILELAYQRQSYRTDHTVYSGTYIDSDDVVKSYFTAGIGFRF